ncbi:MAG: SDR family oxidoreductase [Candidatus Planktophila sp.]
MPARKCAVVTGASSGIGAATVRALAASGYEVIACARRMDRLEALAAENSAITAHALDITNQASVDQLLVDLKDLTISVLINCAGGAFDAATVLDSDPEIWSKTYDLNVVGTVRMVKAFTPQLLSSGAGHIVIISSTAGHVAYENGGSYVAAKHAETSLARTLRLELNGLPIRVTEIAPGMVKTEEFAKIRFGDAERAAKVYEGVDAPLTAEDVAEAIRWSVCLPTHFNIDSMVIRPVAQAANHKVHRTK